MTFDFSFDYETGERHIYNHNVSAKEVKEAFEKRQCFTIKRKDKSYVSFCKVRERYLKIIYRKRKSHYFIITAYDIEDKEIINDLERCFYESD